MSEDEYSDTQEVTQKISFEGLTLTSPEEQEVGNQSVPQENGLQVEEMATPIDIFSPILQYISDDRIVLGYQAFYNLPKTLQEEMTKLYPVETEHLFRLYSEYQQLKTDISDNNGWDQVHLSPTISTLYRRSADSPVHALKIHLLLQCPLTAVCSLANEVELIAPSLGSFATSTKLQIHRTAQLSRYSMLVSMFCSLYWPLGNRDVGLDGQGIDELESGLIAIIARPIPLDQEEFQTQYRGTAAEKTFQPHLPNTVRMRLYPSGGLIRALGPNQTLLSAIFCVDPCVSFIPLSLINYTTRTLAHVMLQHIQKLVESYDSSLFAIRIRQNRNFYERIETLCRQVWLGNGSHAHPVIGAGASTNNESNTTTDTVPQNVLVAKNLFYATKSLPGNPFFHMKISQPEVSYFGNLQLFTAGRRFGFGKGWSILCVHLHPAYGLSFFHSQIETDLEHSLENISPPVVQIPPTDGHNDFQDNDSLIYTTPPSFRQQLEDLGLVCKSSCCQSVEPTLTKCHRTRARHTIDSNVLVDHTVSCSLVLTTTSRMIDPEILSPNQLVFEQMNTQDLVPYDQSHYEPEAIWIVTAELSRQLIAIHEILTAYPLEVLPLDDNDISKLKNRADVKNLAKIRLRFKTVSDAKSFVIELASMRGIDIFSTGILYYTSPELKIST